jgi:hypothetical protein
MEKKLNFNVDNLAFEIHECGLSGYISDEFIDAWWREWQRLGFTNPYSISLITTSLGDTFEFGTNSSNNNTSLKINGKDYF